MLLDVSVFAPGCAALVAGVFALPVLAQRRCVALVLALVAMISILVVLAVRASATWLAPVLVDAVLAVGVHGWNLEERGICLCFVLWFEHTPMYVNAPPAPMSPCPHVPMFPARNSRNSRNSRILVCVCRPGVTLILHIQYK